MNELQSLCFVIILDGCNSVLNINPFHRNHAIAFCRKDSACHDLDSVVGAGERLHRVAGMLRSLDRKTSIAAGKGIILEGHAVHRHAVEWWLIALGQDRLLQNPAGSPCQWHRFSRERWQRGADRLCCFCRRNHRFVSSVRVRWHDGRYRGGNRLCSS